MWRLLVAVPLLLGVAGPSTAAPGPPSTPPARTELAMPPDRVMASLNEAIAWYRQARGAMRSVNGATGPIFSRDDEQAALHLLQRAFDVAHGEAALLAPQKESPGAGAKPASDQRGAQVESSVRQDEDDVTQLEKRLGTVPAAQRTAVARDLAAASLRLELDRTRLQFLTSLEQLDASVTSGDTDLPHRIEALQESIPELRSQAPEPAPGTSAQAATSTWTLVHRLIALQRSRGSLKDLSRATNSLARTVDSDARTVRETVAPIMGRLRSLAKAPGTEGRSIADDEQEFHELLDRLKLLRAVVLPLRQESALAHRYASEITSRQSALDRQSLQLLQDLGVELIGVVIALVVIGVVALVWRIAVVRYVTDAYRRRLLLNARNVAAVVAIALVLVFHFTTELAALVTALGFAAAGIAFALQNVILAVAGYFSIVAPNGIRVGDRVSLQGPFGYVHGEVSDIGLVRIKLRELTGDPPQPTGRIVVFPNSVVFTGSFFKS